MSKVNIKDINFFNRYVNIELFGVNSEDNIVENLRNVYHFIDDVEGGISIRPLGYAYRKIKKIAREKYGRSRKYVISKRQVANLIKIYNDCDCTYVKIPYTADYIFKAIFFILEEYREDEVDLPLEIEILHGKLRRMCFYNKQSDSLKRVCDVESPNLIRDLNYDLNSDKGALGKSF